VERRVNVVCETVAKVPGVSGEMFVPESTIAAPHLRVRWNTDKIRLNVADVIKRLRRASPRLRCGRIRTRVWEISVWLLAPAKWILSRGGERNSEKG